MKKTKKTAMVGQWGKIGDNFVRCRLYEDNEGFMFVKLDGDFVSISWLSLHGASVKVEF